VSMRQYNLIKKRVVKAEDVYHISYEELANLRLSAQVNNRFHRLVHVKDDQSDLAHALNRKCLYLHPRLDLTRHAERGIIRVAWYEAHRDVDL
jgi:hypothetical protein